jgi:ThiF family
MRSARRAGRAAPVPYDHEDEATVVVVGCGGTGGFLAEAVGRLLLGRTARLCLVDPDRVEPHNVARQAFDRADTGRFKAQVLLGNATRARGLRGAFPPGEERCRSLPAPNLQRPDLLEAPPAPPEARTAPDCAQAVARGDQGPTVVRRVTWC